MATVRYLMISKLILLGHNMNSQLDWLQVREEDLLIDQPLDADDAEMR